MTILCDLEMFLGKLAIVNFQELDYRPTPMGLLTLRRRKEITLGIDIYEIKLDEDFLMSSLFTVAEVALANLGLAELSEPEVDVVVGGLGLGYTARTVLEHSKVRELLIVDTMREVIEWHQQGLLPLGEQLTSRDTVGRGPLPPGRVALQPRAVLRGRWSTAAYVAPPAWRCLCPVV